MSVISTFRLNEVNRKGWFEEIASLKLPEYANAAAMAEFVKKAAAAAERWLPSGPAVAIAGLNRRNCAPAVLIQNLPVDAELPPLPDDGYRPASKATAVSEAVLLGTASLYGPTYTYCQEKRGTMPADVIPVQELASTQSNASRGEFFPHADNNFLRREYAPEALFLSGLIGNDSAKTALYPINRLAAYVEPQLLEALMKPQFQVRIPQSFDAGGYEIWSPPRPILTEEEGGWCVTAAGPAGMRGLDAEASAALQRYAQLLLEEAPREYVGIGPGMLLGFSNLRNLHARTAFEGDRWLQRCFARQNLDALREATGLEKPGYAFDVRMLIR